MNKVIDLVINRLKSDSVNSICMNARNLWMEKQITTTEYSIFKELIEKKEPKIFSRLWFNQSFNKTAWLVRKLSGASTYWWSNDANGREQKIKFLEGLN